MKNWLGNFRQWKEQRITWIEQDWNQRLMVVTGLNHILAITLYTLLQEIFQLKNRLILEWLFNLRV